MAQRSNAGVFLGLVALGILTLIAIQGSIAQGHPPLDTLRFLIVLCPVAVIALWFATRVNGLPKQTPAEKSTIWMIGFGFLTGGTLMISWQGLFRPVTGYDRMLGVALLLAAVGLGSLSVRSFLRMRAERTQTESQEWVESVAASPGFNAKSRTIGLGILACLSLLISVQQMVWPFQNYERELAWGGLILSALFGFQAFRAHQNMERERDGEPAPVRNDTTGLRSPKLGLAIAAVFGLLIILGDVRFIRRGNVQAGVIQMAVWLPITGYYGFREYGRLKRMKNG